MKFGTRVRLKSSNDRGEFELDRARSKNNIAVNSIALEHETDNSQNTRQAMDNTSQISNKPWTAQAKTSDKPSTTLAQHQTNQGQH